MHLNVKNHEAHELAAALSRLTGESLTAAVTAALRERLARERRRRDASGIAKRLIAIGQRYTALPEGAHASPEAVIDYDENGLPR